jgi:hypothetical protein
LLWGCPFSFRRLSVSRVGGFIAATPGREHNAAYFIVRDHNGNALAYVYFENEPGATCDG